MAAYRPKSLDDLNNQYDKVKSADQAIKQGQSKLGANVSPGQGAQRVTWNYDPAKYRVSKEEAAELTGSVDRFIKEFSTRQKPQASALELARESLESTEQPQLQQDTVAAFDALLERAKAETSQAVQQAQEPPAAAQPLTDVQPQPPVDAAAHHSAYQSAGGQVKEGELSGLMDEYMSVMNDEDESERGGRFRRRRKERKHAKDIAPQPVTPPVPQMPAVPFDAPAAEPELPQDFLAPEDDFEIPVEVIAPVADAFDIPEEVAAPVEDAFDIPEEVAAPVEDVFDVPEEVAAPAEDVFDVPEEVAAPAEDVFDIPEEVATPVEDGFDIPEDVIAPAEDVFDVPEEVTAPAEDVFDVPEDVIAPAEDGFDIPEEVAAPVEDVFDVPKDVAAPAEDVFNVPEDVIAPAEDVFDVPEEVAAPAEDVFDVPEEVTAPAEDMFEIPAAEPAEAFPEEAAAPDAEIPASEEIREPEDFIFPEEFLMPVIEPEETGDPSVPVVEAPQAFDEPEQAFVLPTEAPEEAVVLPIEEAAQEAAVPAEEAAAAEPEPLFSDFPQDTQDEEAPQMIELPETEEAFGEAEAFPTQFEDVQSYSTDADPDDRFVPLEDLPADAAKETPAPPAEDAETPVLDPEPEADETPREVPAPPVKAKKEHRFLRGIGKFFCSIFLIVSLLATLCVALLGTVLGINSGAPTIGDYYLFTASNTYEGTAVDEGDLVLCQQTGAIPNDAGVVYIDAQSHSFSFGVKRSDRIDSARNVLVYDVSGVTVEKENLLGTVVQTLPRIGIYVRYIIDHFVPLISGCAALDVLWILFLILLSRRRREVETAAEPEFTPEVPQNDLYNSID